MTVDRALSSSIGLFLSPNIVDSKRGRIKQWKCEDLDFYLIRDGFPLGENSIVQVPYALCVEKDDKLIFSIQIEREDLRILSSMTGESLRELQSDYGVKGFLSKETVSMYGDDKRESLGSFDFQSFSNEAIVDYLLDAALDSLECEEEALEV